jgi:Glycine-zipper domain
MQYVPQRFSLVAGSAALIASLTLLAQQPPAPAPPAMPPAPARAPLPPATAPSSPSLSSSLGVHVYPAKGQGAATLSADENNCFEWAKGNTGIDPLGVMQAAPTTSVPPAGPGSGAAVRGGARGAAGGAVIGAIAGDAGQGAAIGAVTGAVVGGARRRQQQQAAAQQQQQEVQQSVAQQKDTFNKSYSACMEGKGYAVK